MSPRRQWRRILLASLTLLLAFSAAVASLWYHYSTDARFHRSKAALDAYAVRVMSSDPSLPPPQPPQPLGAFLPGEAKRLPHGFYFYADYGNPFDANGFAYSTVPLPRVLDDRLYLDHIEDNWYYVWDAEPVPIDRTPAFPQLKRLATTSR